VLCVDAATLRLSGPGLETAASQAKRSQHGAVRLYAEALVMGSTGGTRAAAAVAAGFAALAAILLVPPSTLWTVVRGCGLVALVAVLLLGLAFDLFCGRLIARCITASGALAEPLSHTQIDTQLLRGRVSVRGLRLSSSWVDQCAFDVFLPWFRTKELSIRELRVALSFWPSPRLSITVDGMHLRTYGRRLLLPSAPLPPPLLLPLPAHSATGVANCLPLVGAGTTELVALTISAPRHTRSCSRTVAPVWPSNSCVSTRQPISAPKLTSCATVLWGGARTTLRIMVPVLLHSRSHLLLQILLVRLVPPRPPCGGYSLTSA
jgi:hypothetical protein